MSIGLIDRQPTDNYVVHKWLHTDGDSHR